MDGGSILSVAASIATQRQRRVDGRRGRGSGRAASIVADGEAGRGNGVMEHSVIRYRSINTKYTTAADNDDRRLRSEEDGKNAGSADSLMID